MAKLSPKAKRRIFWLAAIEATALICFFWRFFWRDELRVIRPGELPASMDAGHIANQHLVGRTREEIEARYGPPTRKWLGSYGHPYWQWYRLYPDQVSWQYNHPNGTLYVSFIKQYGVWRCSTSIWWPEGYDEFRGESHVLELP